MPAQQTTFEISPFPKGDGSKTPVTRKRDTASIVFSAVGLLLISLALTIAAYPFVSSRWGAFRANQQFTEERGEASQYDQDDVDNRIAAAERYNARIAGSKEGGGAIAYEDLLDYDDANIMCWLEIPKLDVRLPVFHDDGTDEVPAEGAEHVRGTSLPVGGASSNTVITAHSGSHQGASMAFNKLEFLEPDDIIILWTLGRPYAYRVTGYEITDPDDTSRLGIERGIDKLTLLTCRPIGTTAQRLFVHAIRTDYDAHVADSRVEMLADPDLLPFLAALGMGVAALWIFLLLLWRKHGVWYLNRAIGGIELSPGDVVRITDGKEVPWMRLELKPFRRSRLYLFGGQIKGRWQCVEGDDALLRLEFESDSRGDSFIECVNGFGRMCLPSGQFEVACLDDEIAIPIGYPETTLVFARTKPVEEDEIELDEEQHVCE